MFSLNRQTNRSLENKQQTHGFPSSSTNRLSEIESQNVAFHRWLNICVFCRIICSSTLLCPQGPVGRFFLRNILFHITFWHQIQKLRKISFRSAPIAPLEVLCASSYGSSKVKFDFWSQCKVLCFSIFCACSFYNPIAKRYTLQN